MPKIEVRMIAPFEAALKPESSQRILAAYTKYDENAFKSQHLIQRAMYENVFSNCIDQKCNLNSYQKKILIISKYISRFTAM